ncbi:MAG: hypothetical protein WBZ36_21580, partial [Candidatus Nitrosopolaris sp.]
SSVISMFLFIVLIQFFLRFKRGVAFFALMGLIGRRHSIDIVILCQHRHSNTLKLSAIVDVRYEKNGFK